MIILKWQKSWNNDIMLNAKIKKPLIKFKGFFNQFGAVGET